MPDERIVPWNFLDWSKKWYVLLESSATHFNSVRATKLFKCYIYRGKIFSWRQEKSNILLQCTSRTKLCPLDNPRSLNQFRWSPFHDVKVNHHLIQLILNNLRAMEITVIIDVWRREVNYKNQFGHNSSDCHQFIYAVCHQIYLYEGLSVASVELHKPIVTICLMIRPGSLTLETQPNQIEIKESVRRLTPFFSQTPPAFLRSPVQARPRVPPSKSLYVNI